MYGWFYRNCRISSVWNFKNWPWISSIFLTGIKNISIRDTIFSIWLSSLPLGEDLGQFEFSVSTTMELPSPWSPQLWIFLHHSLHGARFAFAMVSIWLPLSSYRHPIHRRNSNSEHRNDWCSSFGKYQCFFVYLE